MMTFDDIKDDLHPSLLTNPSKYTQAAAQDQILEASLLKSAQRRGITQA